MSSREVARRYVEECEAGEKETCAGEFMYTCHRSIRPWQEGSAAGVGAGRSGSCRSFHGLLQTALSAIAADSSPPKAERKELEAARGKGQNVRRKLSAGEDGGRGPCRHHS